MKKLLVLYLIAVPFITLAQQSLTGKILGRFNSQLQPLGGALVTAPVSGFSTYTDEAGKFSFTLAPNDSMVLISYMGFIADTELVKGLTHLEIVLDAAHNLQEVKVKSKRDESYISTLNSHKTEVISTEGLRKNACCSLAESFESNPTVDATTSDAVTGNKQIQMLGLSGIYVQMQTDLLPGIRGLNVITGLSDIPGPFIEAIHIRKGPGSVANGYEAITGQIDVEMIKPKKADKFFINGYAATDSRMELNTYVRKDLGKWSTLTMVHGSRLTVAADENVDGFFDKPTFKRLSAIHRWQNTSRKGKNSEFGIKWFYNKQESGNIETRYEYLAPFAYAIRDENNRQEAFAKTLIALGKKSGSELGLQFLAVHNDRSMQFGKNNYKAEEFTGYVNSLFQLLSNTTKHTYRFGTSSYISRYTETLLRNAGTDSAGVTGITYDLSRNEITPGVFAEYTYDNLKKFSLIAGIRADYAPTKSFIATPRFHLRYKILDNLVLRASAGTGWRMSHPVAENLGYMISSRTLVFDEALKPERALNYGINLTHAYKFGKRVGDWSFDMYRTQFMEQTVVNLDRSPYEIHFSNLNGTSYANSMQLQVKQELIKGLVLLMAGKWNDARTTYDGKLLQKPFSPKWRGLVNVGYIFWKEKIKVDFTTQIVGSQRIPNLSTKADYVGTTSPAYTKLLAQITYIAKSWEVYIGGENLSNYQQSAPVIGAGDAFGTKFDAAMIWGPVIGPMFYTGFRFKILNK